MTILKALPRVFEMRNYPLILTALVTAGGSFMGMAAGPGGRPVDDIRDN